MWYTPYETSTRKKILKYFLCVAIILWLLISFIIWYFYFFSTGYQEDLKWWTFVEWIFDEVSYLPYLKTDDQSSFYQRFLFRSCLNPYNVDENWQFEQDLCKVYTEDNQHFIIKIIDENAVWSDWVHLTIDDVFFTYDQILRLNYWELSSLKVWSDISVYFEDWKVHVLFPTISDENIRFFMNPILPKHLLYSKDLQYYKNTFSLDPITSSCANIVSQVKDINSLVFDLNNCQNTKFSYYQVKSFSSFDDFNNYLKWVWQKAIIDAYNSDKSIEWFSWQKVLTSNLFWVFFNTDSNKLNVRVRRSLWGLIFDKFFTWDYQNYINKYNWDFINYYVSSWDNVKELMSRLSLDELSWVWANDLKDSWAKELPSNLSINWVDRKFVYFTQNWEGKKNIEIKFSNEFSDIKIYSSTNNVSRSPKGYKSWDKKVNYTLTFGENLKVWSNNFVISWFIKNKTYTIASIDIYVFENFDSVKPNNRRLEVLYFDDLVSNFVVQQIMSIFKDAWILDNFLFQPVYLAEELEWKLLMWTYDIYLWPIDLWVKKDILSLFGTEDPLQNPARYRNPRLSSLISQYYKSNDEAVKNEINSLLAQEMPLIFLWKTFDIIQLQEKVKSNVFSGDNDSIVSSQDWRNDIYSNYSIVRSVRLNYKESLSLSNFVKFIKWMLWLSL